MTAGAFRREVRLAAGPREARGIVHDDFHRFRVRIQHDGAIIRAVSAETRRGPFSLCPDAGESLQELVGLSLTPHGTDIFSQVDARFQCTHQFDLAAFTVATAARGTDRHYRVEVPDLVDGHTTATVERDGAPVMGWLVHRYAIVAPERFAGRGLGQGFTDWVVHHLDPDEGEAALVLRRGVFVSRGRTMRKELDRTPHAPITGACWVQQPERARSALRPPNVIRDFSETGVPFDADDRAWLGEVA